MSIHTDFQTTPTGDVSFTVYRNNGKTGNFLTDLGLSATALTSSIDTGAKFIYMYQAFAIKGPVEELQITSPNSGVFQTAGYLTGAKDVFKDSVGTVGRSANPTYGNTPNVGDVAGDHNPATVDVGVYPLGLHSGFTDQGVPVSFGSIAVVSGTTTPGAKNPNDFNDNSLSSGFVVFSFHDSKKPADTTHQINTGQTSVVVFLTSNFGPQYDVGAIHDGGTTFGDIPTVLTPEPGSLVLCGLGVSFLGFYGWRRRGLKAQPAVA